MKIWKQTGVSQEKGDFFYLISYSPNPHLMMKWYRIVDEALKGSYVTWRAPNVNIIAIFSSFLL